MEAVESADTAETPLSNPVESLIDRLRGNFARDNAEGAEDAENATRAENTENTAPATEPTKATEEPAKEAAKPDDPGIELRHARLKDKHRAVTNELVKARSEVESLRAFRQEVEAKFSKNPIRAMEEFSKLSVSEINERGKRGDFDDHVAKLSPEVQEAVEYARQARQREAEAQKQAERQTAMAADLPKVQAFLQEKASEFPIWTSFPDSATELLHEIYERQERGETADARKLIAGYEAQGVKTFTDYLTNKQLVTHLAATVPSVREALQEALAGLTKQPKPAQQAAARAPEDQVIRSVAEQTEVSSRISSNEDEEERAESMRLLREFRTQGLL